MPRTLFNWKFEKTCNILTCLLSNDAWSSHPWENEGRIMPYLWTKIETRGICRLRTTGIGPLCFMFAWIHKD